MDVRISRKLDECENQKDLPEVESGCLDGTCTSVVEDWLLCFAIILVIIIAWYIHNALTSPFKGTAAPCTDSFVDSLRKVRMIE